MINAQATLMLPLLVELRIFQITIAEVLKQAVAVVVIALLSWPAPRSGRSSRCRSPSESSSSGSPPGSWAGVGWSSLRTERPSGGSSSARRSRSPRSS